MFPSALSSGAWPSIRKNAPPRRRLKRRRRENAKNRSAREGDKRTEFREGRILLEPFRAGNKLRNGLSPLHTGEPFRARGTSCGCRSCPSGQANRSAREKLSKATDGGHGIPPKKHGPTHGGARENRSARGEQKVLMAKPRHAAGKHKGGEKRPSVPLFLQ